MLNKLSIQLSLLILIALVNPYQALAVVHPALVVLHPSLTYQYTYSLMRADGMGLEQIGNLALRFSSDGTITGSYGPDDDFPTFPVTGERTGDKFWIDMGSSTMYLLHVSGTIHADGSLHAYAFKTQRPNPIYAFTATLK